MSSCLFVVYIVKDGERHYKATYKRNGVEVEWTSLGQTKDAAAFLDYVREQIKRMRLSVRSIVLCDETRREYEKSEAARDKGLQDYLSANRR